MNRFILSAIIATGFHIVLIILMPSMLKKNDIILTPPMKPVLVSLSYKKPVIEKVFCKPDIQTKENPKTTEIEKIKSKPETGSKPEKNIFYLPKKRTKGLLKKKHTTKKITQQSNPITHALKPDISPKLPPAKALELGYIKPEKNQTPEKQLPPPKKTMPQTKETIKQKQDHIEFAKPLYKKNPDPVYPVIARKRGYQGTVELEVLISEKGTVSSIKIFKSSGHKSLDQQALISVKKWLFEPGKKNGIIQEMCVRIPVKFELK